MLYQTKRVAAMNYPFLCFLYASDFQIKARLYVYQAVTIYD